MYAVASLFVGPSVSLLPFCLTHVENIQRHQTFPEHVGEVVLIFRTPIML